MEQQKVEYVTGKCHCVRSCKAAVSMLKNKGTQYKKYL
jgi:hypothetical protein